MSSKWLGNLGHPKSYLVGKSRKNLGLRFAMFTHKNIVSMAKGQGQFERYLRFSCSIGSESGPHDRFQHPEFTWTTEWPCEECTRPVQTLTLLTQRWRGMPLIVDRDSTPRANGSDLRHGGTEMGCFCAGYGDTARRRPQGTARERLGNTACCVPEGRRRASVCQTIVSVWASGTQPRRRDFSCRHQSHSLTRSSTMRVSPTSTESSRES